MLTVLESWLIVVACIHSYKLILVLLQLPRKLPTVAEAQKERVGDEEGSFLT